MGRLSQLWIGGVLAAVALILSGCEATVTPPPGGPQFCPQIYQPVCGQRGAQRQTFPNACTANASGFQVIAQGQCASVPPKTDRLCPADYLPVCAAIGGRLATYHNSCLAGAAGARMVRQGPC